MRLWSLMVTGRCGCLALQALVPSRMMCLAVGRRVEWLRPVAVAANGFLGRDPTAARRNPSRQFSSTSSTQSEIYTRKFQCTVGTDCPDAGEDSDDDGCAVGLDGDDDDDDDDDDSDQDSGAVPGGTKGRSNIKVRQHVNPLSSKHMVPLKLSDGWLQEAFCHPRRPLILDIGCAKGAWALEMAQAMPTRNLLGLEIRQPVVGLCMRRKQRRGLTNVHFLTSNANVDLKLLLRSLTQHGVPIEAVTIQFPDPHFKRKHQKRRLVNEAFLLNLAQGLAVGTEVLLQTDVEELADYMVTHFLQFPHYFRPAEGFDATRLGANGPRFEVRTEREVATQAKQQPVFRMLFVRSELAFSEPESISSAAAVPSSM